MKKRLNYKKRNVRMKCLKNYKSQSLKMNKTEKIMSTQNFKGMKMMLRNLKMGYII